MKLLADPRGNKIKPFACPVARELFIFHARLFLLFPCHRQSNAFWWSLLSILWNDIFRFFSIFLFLANEKCQIFASPVFIVCIPRFLYWKSTFNVSILLAPDDQRNVEREINWKLLTKSMVAGRLALCGRDFDFESFQKLPSMVRNKFQYSARRIRRKKNTDTRKRKNLSGFK